jgi:hypothetical protein
VTHCMVYCPQCCAIHEYDMETNQLKDVTKEQDKILREKNADLINWTSVW